MAEKKRNLVSTLAEALEIPQDVAGSFKLTTWGRELLRLENHHGIVAYSGDLIICAVAAGRLEIRGHQLRLAVLETDELWIEGIIEAIDFVDEEEA